MPRIAKARRTIASAVATMALAAGITLAGAASANAAIVNMQCSGYSGVADGYKIGVCVQLDNNTGVYYGLAHLIGAPSGTTDVRYYSTFSYNCPGGSATLDYHTAIAPQYGTDVQYPTYYGSASPKCTYTEYAYFTESGNYKEGATVSWTSP